MARRIPLLTFEELAGKTIKGSHLSEPEDLLIAFTDGTATLISACEGWDDDYRLENDGCLQIDDYRFSPEVLHDLGLITEDERLELEAEKAERELAFQGHTEKAEKLQLQRLLEKYGSPAVS